MSEKREVLNILVTGASGFIGQHLVPRLIKLGHNVRIFSRSNTVPPSLAHYQLNHYRGDITDYEAVLKAVQGADLVYHLAGLVSYRKSDFDEIYAVNVAGTRNVMQACLHTKVKRVIHTSSVAALGIPNPGEIGNEDIKYNLTGLGLTYCDTKYLAEQEVMSCVASGLPAIILNPGIIFGEGDTHPHHHTIFATMSKASLIGVPPGGVTFSDINDVIDAHINCIDMGKVGQRYAVVSANLSFKQAAQIFAQLYDTRRQAYEIPGSILVALGSILENTLPLFGIKPPLTRQAAWLSQYKIFFSSNKAMSEIAFRATPFEETVRRTAHYYSKGKNQLMQKTYSPNQL